MHFNYAYTDDGLVASCTPEEHLRKVLEHFKQYGVIIRPSKCVLGVTSIHNSWTQSQQ